MFTCLSPGAVGIKLSWEECLPIAQRIGFQAIDVQIDLKNSPAWYKDKLASHKLLPGGMVLPVDFRSTPEKYEAGMHQLPQHAAAAKAAGLTRFFIWILPFSDTMTYRQNFAFHVERLKPAAKIFADHGCTFALEFVGPRSMRVGHKFSFARTIEQMLELCDACGPNCGLLLDCWHWHTSLGTLEEIRVLDKKQVQYVHVNDAPVGVAVENLKDNVRAMPGSTGVIDIGGFMNALRDIGYDGPIVAEPFDPSLAKLPPEQSARLTFESLQRIASAQPK